MSNQFNKLEINKVAFEYRQRIVQLAQDHSFGIHLGGALSLAEILSVLYFSIAKVNPDNPDWVDRDRIILSKGHGNVGLLTILAMKSYFRHAELNSFNRLGSHFSMHPDARVPGVEHSTGSLGHGLSVSIGMALSAKLDKKSWNVYCILGDGESMEGSVWEAIMSAGHYQLDNLTAIVDRNSLSQENQTESVMSLEPFAEKYRAFGWCVKEVDGHDVEALWNAFNYPCNGKPKVIIAKTRKGRGVSDYENITKSHFANLTPEQAADAMKTIAEEREKLGLK